VVTVFLGVRLRQLHPDESLDAAKADRAGTSIRFCNGLLAGRRYIEFAVRSMMYSSRLLARGQMPLVIVCVDVVTVLSTC
jgi:hypothetical protein